MSKYIKQLEDKDIEEFLNANGYELARLYDNDGELIPSIDRNDNDIFVRCRYTKDSQLIEEIKDYMKDKNPYLASFLLRGEYLVVVDGLLFKDFEIERLTIMDNDNREDNLNNNYLQMMRDKFGKEYIQDQQNANLCM